MGGASSFGKDFPQENFIQEAKYRGMLAMIPDAEGNVNSKFLITVKPLKVLNGKRTVIRNCLRFASMYCFHVSFVATDVWSRCAGYVLCGYCRETVPAERVTNGAHHHSQVRHFEAGYSPHVPELPALNDIYF